MVAAGDVRARVACARLCVLWMIFGRALVVVLRYIEIVGAVGVVGWSLMC